MEMSIFRSFWFVSLLLVLAGICLPKQAAAQQPSPDSAWTIRCAGEIESSVENTECEIFQRLVISETGQRVAEFAVGFPPNQEDARGVIVLPLGIMLTDSLEMVIDEDQRFRFRVRYCTMEGCFAFIRLTEQILTALKRGNEAVVHGQTLTGETIDITFSLAGFTKAVRKIGG